RYARSRYRSSGDLAANEPDTAAALNEAWASECQSWSQALYCVNCRQPLATCWCQAEAARCPGCRLPISIGQSTCGRYACVEAFHGQPVRVPLSVPTPSVAEVLIALWSQVDRLTPWPNSEKEVTSLRQAIGVVRGLLPRTTCTDAFKCEDASDS